jgi:hypothetical protein
MITEIEVLCSQKPTTGPYPEQDEYSPQLPIPFPDDSL